MHPLLNLRDLFAYHIDRINLYIFICSDQIMGSIRRHRNAMVALLAEYNEKWNSIDTGEDFDDYTFTKRRFDILNVLVTDSENKI